MSSFGGLTYIDTIEPTLENAKAIQRLSLQDLRAGNFERPLELANPNDANLVNAQRRNLRLHPERYNGYVRDGELVAFMKQNDWLIGDELPFTSVLRAFMLKVRRVIRRKPSMGQWGVFGLVASDTLNSEERAEVLQGLLHTALVDPRTGKARIVNVPIHRNDPLLKIAMKNGFVPLGKRGVAAGTFGPKQQRYQRRVLH